MLSLEKCKKVLLKNGGNYTDEEIIKIRDFLYKMVHLELELLKDLKKRNMWKNELIGTWRNHIIYKACEKMNDRQD
jgi:hypothetical protein